MSSTRLPEISSLLSLPSPTQHQVLDTLFEPSPHLHDLAASLFSQQEHPASYASYNDLIDTVGGSLSKLGASDSPHDREILFDILGSHPRLGEKSPAKLSELSRTEQANLKTAEDQHAANTEAQLRKMNAAYEERFPGLRYV
jgi:2-oxo-4-hydroxy-4-carboxy--5-ureidoimidazoline (OHCU) decarboxylase